VPGFSDACVFATFPLLGNWAIADFALASLRESCASVRIVVDHDAKAAALALSGRWKNRPVEVQFWLDAGSRGWAERLYQPLTHPYVLSRRWQPGRLWTDADELEVGRAALARLVVGLLRRCKSSLYLCLTDLNEQGYEQRGPLLQALQRLIRRSKNDSSVSIG